ncbi:MAG: DUF3857 domain-containing protein [Chitinophagaceae bacterium]
MKLYFAACCLFICQLIAAQSPLPQFGIYTLEEIYMKECAFDKNAGAVILLDHAIADTDEEYRLITHHRIRIKILHQRESDRGNIRIRFYSKDKFEYIANLKAVTFNLEGDNPVLSYLDNKSIFTEKEDNLYSSIKFAFPNVKAGSIIEYEYDSYMKHYGGLSAWLFQDEIPTLKSSYLLTIIPGAEFQYIVQKKPNYPIVIKPIPTTGKFYFEMNNIPGLKFEPYMDAVRDYLQKVEFQLAQYTTAFGDQAKVNQTWKALAINLVNDRDFGGVIKKDISKTDDINIILLKETTDSGKLISVYNYIRKNFTWNGYHSKYATEGLKNVWEKKVGNAGEINLILINLLQKFNIAAYPLLVAERDFGKIDTTYPFIDRFNKVAAYVKADGRVFILDATQKFSPANLIPFSLLNTTAFLVDKKEFKLLRIESDKDVYDNTIIINAKIDSNGLLKGAAKITSASYAKQIRTEKIRADENKFIAEVLKDPGSEIVIDNYKFDNLDDDSNPLVQNVEFHHEQNLSGGFVFLTYNLFTGLTKNPFTADERFTNINFGYPYNINLQLNIQLPEKSKIDKLPPDKTLSFGDKSLIASRSLKVEKNMLIANVQFIQTNTLVPYTQYNNLKAFYKQIVDLLNETVILKINN